MTAESNIAVLPLAYLPPIAYFSVLERFSNVLIEQWDSYHKQTYRNRCRILGANGVLDLVIPVVKDSGKKTLVRDVKIDYSTRWQANHWRSLFSAYNSSPFFEYYADDFIGFYEKKWDFLIDFNMNILNLIVELIGIEKNFKLTDSFCKSYDSAFDLRFSLSPKEFNFQDILPTGFKSYHQTFNEKFGFIENLSIVDLLFNEGRMTNTFL